VSDRRVKIGPTRLAYPMLFLLMLLAVPACDSSFTQDLPVVRAPPGPCSLFAAPGGHDGARGTRSAPLRSAQALVNRLRPGGKGCLETGVYREDIGIRHGGTPGKRVTLTSAPGSLATLAGTLFIAESASYVTLSDLRLNGASGQGVPSPQVNGDHITFVGDDVTNDHTGICFVLGGSSDRYGVANSTTIASSRIHDCGRLPPTHFDHGIYLAHSRDAVIVDNLIYDNADWGLHLYPDAQGSTIEHNVVDGNGDGLIFAGSGDLASSDNVVAENIISNSTGALDGDNYGWNVTSFWGSAVGSGNVLTRNCLWDGAAGNVNEAAGGFSSSGNRLANPDYVSRVTGDFRLRPGSPCTGRGPRTPDEERP
jgi:parallel beta-helix repeat protein